MMAGAADTVARRAAPLLGITALIGLLLWIPASAQDASRPLLMEGKQTLYQRVLTRPGAQLVATPGEATGEPVPALSRFYVYQRKDDSGGTWLQVGSTDQGKTEGWLAADSTLPWKQQLALAFTNPANRERTLLFADRDTVMEVAMAENPGVAVQPIREAVEAGREQPGVVAIEPEEYIDIRENFYLLPILQAQQVSGTAADMTVLEVAAVNADAAAKPLEAQTSDPRPKRVAALRSFKATVVFVIDSTISMGRYIERTKDAVRRIYQRIDAAGLGDKVKFGLVAYRSSTEAVPGLEYLTELFVDPTQVKDGQDFLDKVSALQPAKVSSSRFDEDAYAGVMTALERVDWSAFGGRYLVLITDAGALDPESGFSSTQLGARQVRIEAEQRGVAIYALHLKTPAGERNHASAAGQYKELTHSKVIGRPLYYPLEGGAIETFGDSVDGLAEDMVLQVEGASQGEMVPGSANSAHSARRLAETDSEAAPVTGQLRADAALLGYAMQLAYLGRVEGAESPELFRAWLADRDFADPVIATTEVRVLLTKNQLSDLRDVVKAILDAGEEAQDEVGSADFLDLLRSSAAHLSRDPNQLSDPNATRLGELGLLGEYLEDLPYKSDVLNLDSEIWESYGPGEQEDLLDELRRKIRHYQIYHDDGDRWISLNPGTDRSQDVYPVPIEALP